MIKLLCKKGKDRNRSEYLNTCTNIIEGRQNKIIQENQGWVWLEFQLLSLLVADAVNQHLWIRGEKGGVEAYTGGEKRKSRRAEDTLGESRGVQATRTVRLCNEFIAQRGLVC